MNLTAHKETLRKRIAFILSLLSVMNLVSDCIIVTINFIFVDYHLLKSV